MSQKRHHGQLGTPLGWPFVRQPADQCTKVLYGLVVHRFRRYADRVILLGGLPLSLRVR